MIRISKDSVPTYFTYLPRQRLLSSILLSLPTRIQIPTLNTGQGFIMISYEHDKMIFDDVRGKGDENYADLLHLLNVHIVMMIMTK